MILGRGVFLLGLCTSPFIAQAALTSCQPNPKGYCWGYKTSDKSSWCWLTYDGTVYAKNDGKYHCRDWNGYKASDYCYRSPAPKPAPTPAPTPSSGGSGFYSGWGLRWIVRKHCSSSFKTLAKMVCKFYGTNGYGWGSNGRTSTVHCGSKSVTFKQGGSCWQIVGSIPSGGAAKPADPKPPSQLQGFIASWIPHQLHRSVQRIGETRRGRLECWDLAARAVDEANKNGFDVGIGSSGGSAKWIWSNHEVNPRHAKAGDIAQFSSYRQSRNGYSSSTGTQHTAVVLKDFNSHDCSIQMYDQNPKPVHETTYYPPGCSGYKSGVMKIYRLVSKAGSPWVRLDSEDEESDDMPGFTPEFDEESPLGMPMAMLMAGAIAAMAGCGFVAFRAYSHRKNSCHDRELLINVESGDETTEEAEAAE